MDNVTFEDNQPCVELLERRADGIFSLLADELSVPGGTDKGFLEKL